MIDVYILGHAKAQEHEANIRCSFMKGPSLSLTIHCEPVFRRAPTCLPCCVQGVADSCGYDQGHSSTPSKNHLGILPHKRALIWPPQKLVFF